MDNIAANKNGGIKYESFGESGGYSNKKPPLGIGALGYPHGASYSNNFTGGNYEVHRRS